MSYISSEQLTKVREASNIIDYIEQEVALKKAGKDYVGLCPFHNEKTPSFHVSEERQVFHCFGCGRSGNIFQFAEQYHHLSFPEAVQDVADFFKLDMKIDTGNVAKENPQTKQRQQLIQLHEKAAMFYQHILVNTDQGKEALDYLVKRGLTEEDIQTFGIGYAPLNDKFDPLLTVLENDITEEGLYEASGLFSVSENGQVHDRFVNRIMFPLRNEQGQTVAFSGRLMQKSAHQPKYMNSPETLIFNKSQLLFNLDLAKTAIRERDQVILFEGYMDVIAAYRSGVKNGVASMGTSLTNEQIQRMKHFTNNILICYDGDGAGVEATERARTLLSQDTSLIVNAIWLDEGLDPDEYIKVNGAEAFQNIVAHGALTSIQSGMRYLKRDKDLQNEQDKLQYIDAVMHLFGGISSPVEQDMYLQQLAEEVQLPFATLKQQLTQLVRSSSPPVNEPILPPEESYTPLDGWDAPAVEEYIIPKLDPMKKAQYQLLYRAFYEKWVRDVLEERNFHFPDEHCEILYILLEDYMQWHEAFNEADFYNQLKTERDRQVLADILQMSMSNLSTTQEIQDYMCVIHHQELQGVLEEKKQEMHEAMRMGNKILERQLSQEIMDILKELKR